MPNVSTIVIEQECNSVRYCGRYRYSDQDEYKNICIDGKDSYFWDEGMWQKIFNILQANISKKPYRILFCQTSPLSAPEDDLPKLGLANEWDYLMLKAAITQKGSVTAWYFNNVRLPSSLWSDAFPLSRTGKERYVYTVPVFCVPEEEHHDAAAALRALMKEKEKEKARRKEEEAASIAENEVDAAEALRRLLNMR